MKTISKNTILFGPPGTGKTYSTIKRAIEIVNPSFIFNNKTREEIKREFDRLKEKENIVFTTFHQSMSYEDFIEGIKPITNVQTKNVEYDVLPGIFKQMCSRASDLRNNPSDFIIDFDKVNYFKMSLGGVERADVHDYCLAENFIALGYGGSEDLTSLQNKRNFQEFLARYNEINPQGFNEKKISAEAAYRFMNMKNGDVIIASRGNLIVDAIGILDGDYEYKENSPVGFYHFRKVKWISKNMNASPGRFLLKKISQLSIYELAKEDVRTEALEELVKDVKVNEKSNYVIVIDEINRGNISQIFGELITLIEEDKRIGGVEELRVMLPYSKSSFGVPSNVYILGTMNTADRSVEALDTALRRRFSFEEMGPDLIKLRENIKIQDNEIDLVKTLDVINQRIEKLLTKEHLIGHSFFMNIRDLKELHSVFMNKIIPLLQEYFYGDYGKIGLILGEGFVDNVSKKYENIFAQFRDYVDDESGAKDIFRIKNVKEKDFKQAFINIIN